MRQDKIEHWAFGFVLSLGGIFFYPLVFGGIIFTAGKEIYDIKYGTVDVMDAVAGVVGVFSALPLVVLL